MLEKNLIIFQKLIFFSLNQYFSISLLLYFKLKYALFSLKYFFNYQGERTQGECVVRANGPDTIIQRPYKSLKLLVWSTNYKKLSPWQGGYIYIMWRASGGFGKINQEIPITSRVSSNRDSFTILFQWKLHERNRRCPWSQ